MYDGQNDDLYSVHDRYMEVSARTLMLIFMLYYAKNYVSLVPYTIRIKLFES